MQHWTRLEQAILALRARPQHTMTPGERTVTLLVIRIGLLSVFTAMLGAGVLYVSLFTMDVSEGVNPVVVAGIIFTGVGAFLALLAAALDVGRIIVYGH